MEADLNKSIADSDLRGLLKVITSPSVWPFISRRKLFESEQFARLIKNHDEHFLQHRDTGQFERILAMLDGSKYRDVFAEYLRTRHGLHVLRVDGFIKITLPKNSAGKSINKEIPFTQFIAALKPSQIIKIAEKNEHEKSLSKVKNIDALDHPARLPGSFGHGSRK